MPVAVPQLGQEIDPHAVYHLNTVADAKEEWMCQLVDLVGPKLIGCFQRIAECAPRVARKQNMPAIECLICLLKEVPKWNVGIIQDQVREMFREEEEKTVYDVLKACYVATTVVMASIRTQGDGKELQITVPKVDMFVHECCKSFAERLLTTDPLLIVKQPQQVNARDRAYKRDQLDRIGNKCVRSTLRRMLPIKQMMKSYLDDVLVEDEGAGNGTTTAATNNRAGDETAAAEAAETQLEVVAPPEDEELQESQDHPEEPPEQLKREKAEAAEQNLEDTPVVAAAEEQQRQQGGDDDDDDNEPVVYRSRGPSAQRSGLESFLRDVATMDGGGGEDEQSGNDQTALQNLDFNFWPDQDNKIVELDQ